MTITSSEINGYVTSIGRKYFWARLHDVDFKGDDYEAKIPISKVTKRDNNVFNVGALFTIKFNKSRISLKFSHRRYLKSELEESRKRAKELLSKINRK